MTRTDDELAQAYVDAGNYTTFLSLCEWSSITIIPLRIPNTVKAVTCNGCSRLTSMAGLPQSVTTVYFSGCSSLTSVTGLTENVAVAFFGGCTSLKSVAGLPKSVTCVYFSACTFLTSVTGLPESVQYADFTGCIRLRRVQLGDERYHFDVAFDPAREVHTMMVSGVSDLLLSVRVGVGRDVALLIGRFVTYGMCETDRMETMLQVRARYGFQ